MHITSYNNNITIFALAFFRERESAGGGERERETASEMPQSRSFFQYRRTELSSPLSSRPGRPRSARRGALECRTWRCRTGSWQMSCGSDCWGVCARWGGTRRDGETNGNKTYTWSLKVPRKLGTSACFLWGHVPFSKVRWRVQVRKI